MKPLQLPIACAFMSLLVLTLSCKKEGRNDRTRQSTDQLPVAIAGPDKTVSIVSCNSGRTVELDGSQSYAPDNYQLYYYWSKVSGPPCTLTSEVRSPKAQASNLTTGQYVFELLVSNNGASAAREKGLTAKDTVVIDVTGTPSPMAVDLSITANGSYRFLADYKECYETPWWTQCFYYDLTTVEGNFNLPAVGQMIFWMEEHADTAIAGTSYRTTIGLSCTTCVPSQSVSGSSTIHLKRLIQQGGGSFSGTLEIDGGSASGCVSNIFTTLAPLTVVGNLDTTMHTVSIAIKGKAFF